MKQRASTSAEHDEGHALVRCAAQHDRTAQQDKTLGLLEHRLSALEQRLVQTERAVGERLERLESAMEARHASTDALLRRLLAKLEA